MAKMGLQKNKFYMESPYPEVLDVLLKVVSLCRLASLMTRMYLGKSCKTDGKSFQSAFPGIGI